MWQYCSTTENPESADLRRVLYYTLPELVELASVSCVARFALIYASIDFQDNPRDAGLDSAGNARLYARRFPPLTGSLFSTQFSILNSLFTMKLSMMKLPRPLNSLFPSLWIAVAITAGCASYGVQRPDGSKVTEMRPDERGRVAGTGIESQDLVAVADKMARSLLNVPQVAQVPTAPRIVLDPVVNETRFAINKDMFLDRIRIGLNQRAAGRMVFLARDRMTTLEKERELKRTGAVTSTTDPRPQEFKGADFFLTGKLQSLTTRNSKGVSDYVLYSFQLIDPRTSEIVWEDAAEVKKEGLEDAAYR